MSATFDLAKARRKLTITANDRRIDASARRRQKALERWLKKLAKFMAGEAEARLHTTKTGRFSVAKASGTAALEAELVRILTRFGLRDVDAAGSDMAARLDGDWLVEPELVRSITRSKQVLVQGIVRESRTAARSQIRKLLLDAQRERPRPSVSEVARRIRKTFLGAPGLEPIPTFSAARAELIARTEAVQSENTGIAEGMAVAGVDEIEWLAHTDGRSGDRHHERMNGKRVPMGEKFTTPLGNQLRFPGDPLGPIKETANCRCTIIPVINRKRRVA